ncbi:DUF4296 domain-containing protein [Carboxylicivirga sp. M1479]|uniref:DUF4296 domain-containing protein n=1 Tax=Carboxylicivirga sp. M1479 TaxID=2594476 RepID=UPI00163D99BE|nr:DUF4296 domain-containing protein [Carboxylicivirga sp. M1479]
MLKIFMYISLVVLLFSCSTRPSVPRDLPQEELMAEVLADMYQVESLLGQTRLSYNSSKEDKVSGYYRFILDQHQMTKAEFDTAMSWYSAHPTVLSDVYEEVVEILSRRDAELKNEVNRQKEDAQAQKANKLAGRMSLWEDSTKFNLPFEANDSLDNRIPFHVKVDSLKGGIIRLYAGYTFKEGGFLDSAQIKLLACYADSTIDTVSYQIHKSFKRVNGNLSHQIGQAKSLIELKGYLFDHDTSKYSTVSVEDVKLTFIPTLRAEELMID